MALDDLVHGVKHGNVRVPVQVTSTFLIVCFVLRLKFRRRDFEDAGKDLLHLSDFNAFGVFVLNDSFKNAWQALNPGELQLVVYGLAYLVLDLEQDVAESLFCTYV